MFRPILQVLATLYRVIQWPNPFGSLLQLMKTVAQMRPSFISLECSLTEIPGYPRSVQAALIEVFTPILMWFLAIPIWIAIWYLQVMMKKKVEPKLSK